MSARVGLTGLVLVLNVLGGAFFLIPAAEGQTPLSLPNTRITGATGDTLGNMQYPLSMAAWESVVVVLYGDFALWKPGETPSRSFIQVAVSCDYGKTFREAVDLPRTSDQEQVFWATVGVIDGAFYIADVLDSTPADFYLAERLALWKLQVNPSDCSLIWTGPQVAKTGASDEFSAPYLAADPAGKLYVTYMQWGLTGGRRTIRVLSLNPDGNVLGDDEVAEASGRLDWPRVAVGPDGEVYTIWLYYSLNDSTSEACDLSRFSSTSRIQMSKKPAGGSSWEPATDVASQYINPFSTDNHTEYQAVEPGIAIDRSEGPGRGNVYITWQDTGRWGRPLSATGNVYEREPNETPAEAVPIQLRQVGFGACASTDDVDLWQIQLTRGDHVLFFLAAEGYVCGSRNSSHIFRVRVYAQPQDPMTTALDTLLVGSLGPNNVGSNTPRALFSCRQSGSYLVEVKMRTNRGTNVAYQLHPRIVPLVAPDSENPARDVSDIVFLRSEDGGLSWSPKILVNHDAPMGYREAVPALTVDDRGQIFAFWWDQRRTEGKGGGQARLYDVYTAVSLDQGRTFSPGGRVTDASGVNAGFKPGIGARGERGVAAAYGGDMYVAWSDTRPFHVQSSGIDTYAGRIRWAGRRDLPEISFPSPTLGDPTSSRISLESVGNLPLRITGFQSSLSNVHLVETLPIVIPPGETADLTLITDPLLSPEATGSAVLETNGSFAPSAQLDFTVSGRPIVYDLISDEFFEDPVLALGQQIPILVDMEDSVRVDSVVVHYREGGAVGYERLEMQRLDPPTPANDRYRAYIPQSSVGTRGVEFHVSAWNGVLQVSYPAPEDPRRYRVRVPSLDLPSPTAGEYRMISFPFDTEGARVYSDLLADDLVGEPGKDWRLFELESSTTETTAYRELTPGQDSPSRSGRAFWLITRERTPVDTGPAQGISTPTDSAYTLVLDQAWNMIGNPFNFPVAWNSILVDGEPMAVQEHVEISPRYYVSSEAGWNAENVEILEPFEGYFLRKLVPEDVVLSILPVEAATPSALLTTTSTADGDATGDVNTWEIQVTAVSGGRMTVATAGVSPAGSQGWDREDRCEPPLPPSGGVSVFFPHDDWGYRSGGYSRDIRTMRDPSESGFPEAEPVPGSAWDFSLAGSPDDGRPSAEVTLGFTGLDRVPPHLGVAFVDRALNRVVDLRADPAFSMAVALVPETVPRFSLLVGDSTYLAGEGLDPAPPMNRLLAPFPNPFRGSTVIRYELAEAGPARLVVFDIQGRQVRVLRDSIHEPGVYEAVWRGDGDDGQLVSSGVYFYRLMGPGFTRTRKIIRLQ